MRTLRPDELDALERGKFGKSTALIKMLVLTAKTAIKRELELEERIQEIEAKQDDLALARPDAERQVVAIYGDGYVEIYGEKWHRPKIVHIPNVGQKDELYWMEAVMESLPLPYQELMLPGKILGRGNASGCPTRDTLGDAIVTRGVLRCLSNG